MATRIYKFKDIAEMQHFLNGGVIGGPCRAAIGDIVGKTLIIGATTVTFVAAGSGVDGDQRALRFKDIRAQIQSAVATVDVLLLDGRIGIVLKTPASLTIDKDGTSNPLLGFNSAADTVTKLYADPASGTTPRWSVAYNSQDNSHVVLTTE